MAGYIAGDGNAGLDGLKKSNDSAVIAGSSGGVPGDSLEHPEGHRNGYHDAVRENVGNTGGHNDGRAPDMGVGEWSQADTKKQRRRKDPSPNNVSTISTNSPVKSFEARRDLMNTVVNKEFIRGGI